MPKGIAMELSNCKNGALTFEQLPVVVFDMGNINVDSRLEFLLDFCKKASQQNK